VYFISFSNICSSYLNDWAKFLLGEESGCVSPIKSKEVPENSSMEEAITEEGNPCLTTEHEVQGHRRYGRGPNPCARLGCRRCGSPQLGKVWPTQRAEKAACGAHGWGAAAGGASWCATEVTETATRSRRSWPTMQWPEAMQTPTTPMSCGKVYTVCESATPCCAWLLILRTLLFGLMYVFNFTVLLSYRMIHVFLVV